MISAHQLAEKARRWQQLVPQLHSMSMPVVALKDDSFLVRVDLSSGNPSLAQLDVVDTAAIDAYIQQTIGEHGAAGAIGGYMENRQLYLRSVVFAGEEHRTLHLGVDIWLPAGAPVYAVLQGKVHSFANNANFGDYGPTIILEHQQEDFTFYSLYGHLSRTSLAGIEVNTLVTAGQQIGTLGAEHENGNWPPHLHIQLMLDLEGRSGDFPGVAAPSRRTYFQQLCPDPNPLLKAIVK